MKKNKIKYVIFSILLLSSFLGCSPIETARLTGLGIKPFKAKGDIYSQNFRKNMIDCYHQVEEIIEKLGAISYRGSPDKGFLISFGYNEIFSSANHSTEVAVFFIRQDKNETKVEVSSLNYNLSKFISKKIFQELK